MCSYIFFIAQCVCYSYVRLNPVGLHRESYTIGYVVTYFFYLCLYNLTSWLFSYKYWTVSLEMPIKNERYLGESTFKLKWGEGTKYNTILKYVNNVLCIVFPMGLFWFHWFYTSCQVGVNKDCSPVYVTGLVVFGFLNSALHALSFFFLLNALNRVRRRLRDLPGL
jgi:hypothetical protein